MARHQRPGPRRGGAAAPRVRLPRAGAGGGDQAARAPPLRRLRAATTSSWSTPPSTTGDEFRPRELNLFWGENYLVTIHRRPAAVLARAGGGAQALGAARGRGTRSASPAWRTRSSRAWWTATSRCRTGSASGSRGSRRRSSPAPRARRPTSSGSARSCSGSPASSRRPSHVLAEVLRRERAIPDALRPYFADVQDHALHVLAELDTYRDLLGAALDVHVFYAFNRLGLIMKRLTAMTVIIMVPNFVASIYGMNFDASLSAQRVAVRLLRGGRVPGGAWWSGASSTPACWGGSEPVDSWDVRSRSGLRGPSPKGRGCWSASLPSFWFCRGSRTSSGAIGARRASSSVPWSLPQLSRPKKFSSAAGSPPAPAMSVSGSRRREGFGRPRRSGFSSSW